MNRLPKKNIAIIGGGASALFFAASIDPSKFSVTIYEKNKSLGRKFLVAGDGGFNLTHSEPIEQMITRYTPSKFLEEALLKHDNVHFQNWLKEIGIPTFIGSSKRVYPKKGIKPIEVLNAILQRIKENNVEIKYEQTWTGWKNDKLFFNSIDEVTADIVIFALGGASWKVTGSDGNWLSYFKEKGIETVPFKASNCAFETKWESTFIQNNAGQPLKNIAIKCGDLEQKGEVVITEFGMEGNAIYALSPNIREQFNSKGKAEISVDFKFNVSMETILEKLNSKGKRTQVLKDKVKLSKTAIQLIKSTLSKAEFLDDVILATAIKSLKLTLFNLAPIDEAISTVGGIAISSLTSSFELKNNPNQYCIGEMIDWDAPTGGYLLQGSFSMGRELANLLNKKSDH